MRDFKLRRRFNKLVKDGGAGGGLVVHAVAQGDNTVLSETFRTIKTAMDAGRLVIIIHDEFDVPTTTIVNAHWMDGADYAVCVFNPLNEVYITFKTASEDGYPTAGGGK